MTDTQKVLMAVGEALTDAANNGELPDRVHYNAVDTAKLLGRTLIEHADRIGIQRANELHEARKNPEKGYFAEHPLTPTVEAEADNIRREAIHRLAKNLDVPEELITGEVAPDLAAEVAADFEATQFEAGSIFSAPAGFEPRDWGQAIIDAMVREYGGEPALTLIEILDHAIEQYRIAVATQTRTMIAARVGASGLGTGPEGDARLPEFVALRDFLATGIRDGRL